MCDVRSTITRLQIGSSFGLQSDGDGSGLLASPADTGWETCLSATCSSARRGCEHCDAGGGAQSTSVSSVVHVAHELRTISDSAAVVKEYLRSMRLGLLAKPPPPGGCTLCPPPLGVHTLSPPLGGAQLASTIARAGRPLFCAIKGHCMLFPVGLFEKPTAMYFPSDLAAERPKFTGSPPEPSWEVTPLTALRAPT